MTRNQIEYDKEIDEKKTYTFQQIDEMNAKVKSLAFSNNNASKKLAENVLQIAIKKKYLLGKSSAYHNLGLVYYFDNQDKDSIVALDYYNKAYKLIENSSHLSHKAATLNNIALVYYDRSQFEKAIHFHLRALKLRIEFGENKFIIQSFDNIGNTYLIQNDFENSLKYYLKAFKLKKKQKTPQNIHLSLFNIGRVYEKQEKFAKAIDYFLSALTISDEQNDVVMKGKIYDSLGGSYSHLGKYKQAYKMLNKSLEIYKNIDDSSGYASVLNSFGIYYWFQKDYGKALQYYKDSLKICRNFHYRRDTTATLKNIGLLQTELKMFTQAKSSLDEGLQLALEIDDKFMISGFYKVISLLFLAQNDYEKAYDFEIKYSEINNLINEKEESDNIAKLKVEFNLELKEREAEIHKLKNITLVETNNKLLKSEHNLKELTKTLENRVQEELKKREKQQQFLIQKSKLESMGKLAAGIAHEINQPLGGISMGLENIYFAFNENRLTAEYFDKKYKDIDGYFDRINKIIEHIKLFSRDQKTILFEKININEVIKNAFSLLQTQYKNHDVNVEFKLEKNINFVSGNKFKFEQVVINLFTNAKDAVTEKEHNAEEIFVKKIFVKTYNKKDFVYLEIIDNGFGISKEILPKIFDPFFTTKEPTKGTGLGLSIIYGIIKEMKGEILVESKIEEFTKMKIKLPNIENNEQP